MRKKKFNVSYTWYKLLAATVKKALLTFLTPNKSLNSLVVAMIFLRSEVHSLGWTWRPNGRRFPRQNTETGMKMEKLFQQTVTVEIRTTPPRIGYLVYLPKFGFARFGTFFQENRAVGRSENPRGAHSTAKWIRDCSIFYSIKPKIDIQLFVDFCVFASFCMIWA